MGMTVTLTFLAVVNNRTFAWYVCVQPSPCAVGSALNLMLAVAVVRVVLRKLQNCLAKAAADWLPFTCLSALFFLIVGL